MNVPNADPLPGRWGNRTIYEPVPPDNPPAGSENWPAVEMRVVSRFTMHDPIEADPSPLDAPVADLTRQLAERIASAPEGEQAALLGRIEQEIKRRVAALTATVRDR